MNEQCRPTQSQCVAAAIKLRFEGGNNFISPRLNGRGYYWLSMRYGRPDSRTSRNELSF